MKLIHATDIGQVRETNEDYSWTGTNKHGDTLLIVCDGLGSYIGSKIASEKVVKTYIKSFLEGNYQSSIENWFNDNLEDARKQFAIQVRLNPSQMQMSTTIVLALVVNKIAHVFWMGDSRGYLLKDNLVKEITTDHNLKNKLLKENASPLALERFTEYLLGITSYIGLTTNLPIGYETIDISEDSILILTSDGLHNFIDMNKIFWEFKYTKNLEESTKEIIKNAMRNGSDDNLSFAAMLNLK